MILAVLILADTQEKQKIRMGEEAIDVIKIDIHIYTTYMAHINTTYFGER